MTLVVIVVFYISKNNDKFSEIIETLTIIKIN